MAERIRARRLLTEQGWREHQVLTHEGGVITAIDPIPADDPVREVELLVPALIDGHVHGGAGVDVMDEAADALARLSLAKAAEGVGAFLATTVTAPRPAILSTLARIADAMASPLPGAQLLGSYLEGPYFTPDNKGAHDPALFRELDLAELDRLQQVARGTLKVVALAPEKTGALAAIRHLRQAGIRVMLGHSAADHDTTMAALAAGASGLVHCFNGMRGLHHREPGMVGAGLVHPDAWLELIADGHHVHPERAQTLSLLRQGSPAAHHGCHARRRHAGRSLPARRLPGGDEGRGGAHRHRRPGGQHPHPARRRAQHGAAGRRAAGGGHPHGFAGTGPDAGDRTSPRLAGRRQAGQPARPDRGTQSTTYLGGRPGDPPRPNPALFP